MRRSTRALALLATLASCTSKEGGEQPHTAPPPVPVHALLPTTSPQFAPSQVRLVQATNTPGATIADVDTCATCHLDVASQWRTSAHAFASFNNPVYRLVVDRFRRERGLEKSRFCGGCHDVALLVDGAMDKEVAANDVRAHAGITCRTCHGITRARADGNGSFELDASEVPLPREGDAESLARHKARVTPTPLKTAAMCGTCHKAFLDESTGNEAHLVGQDDYTPWARSVYAGSRSARIDEKIEERDCRGCHMPKEDAPLGDPSAKAGRVSSHRFLGGHSWLAQMRYDQEQVRRVEAFLKTAATIDIAAVRRGTEDGRDRRVFLTGLADPEDVRVQAGDRLIFDVVLRNRATGHRFPGGVMDAQDTWIELTIDDKKGRRLADSGQKEEFTGDDASAHRLSSLMVGAQGTPLVLRETQDFRANVYNHTLAPRAAAVVEYAFDVPKMVNEDVLPLRVTARLRHRTRNLQLQRAACNETKSNRSRAFGRAGLKNVMRALDPCLMQPVTEVAHSEVSIGAGTAPAKSDRSWERQFEHGLGLLTLVQERRQEAKPSLELALARARDDRERGMALAALAELAASQGCTAEALSIAARAASATPGHPAVARIRGEALASSWRWDEAVPHLFEAASSSPRDDAAWDKLAMTLGGIDRQREALDAAQRALGSQPRDQDALRVQALAVAALSHDDTEAAMTAYLQRRPPDSAPLLRSLCSKNVPGCARERLPVHLHELTALWQ